MRKDKEWQLQALGELCVFIRNGITYIPAQENEQGFPITRIETISYEVIDSKRTGLAQQTTKNIEKYRLEYGDILFSHINSIDHIGKTAFFQQGTLFHGMNLFCIRADKNIIEPFYLYQILKTHSARSFFMKSARPAVAQYSLTVGDVASYTVRIPPLAEQRKIAAILHTWDDAIEKYDDVINIKVRLKNYLSIKLLSQKHNHHASKKLLGDLCDITTGKKDVNEGNPNGCYPFYSCAKETTFSDTYSFDTEAILISGNGVGVGYTHYYNGKFEAYQRTYVLRDFADNANIQYVLYYLRQYLRQQILKEKQDSAMPYIKLGLLKEFEIPLPEIGQQLKIVSALMAVDEEIDGLCKQQSIIKSQKRGLMQKLLTGEWRVAVDVEADSKEMAHA